MYKQQHFSDAFKTTTSRLKFQANRLHSHHKEYTSWHCCRFNGPDTPKTTIVLPYIDGVVNYEKERRITPTTTAHKIHKLRPPRSSTPPNNHYEMLSSSIVLESSISAASPFVPFIFSSVVAWLLSLELASLPSVGLVAPAEAAAHSVNR